jgi:peptidyl-prolyl cis-trans isomerase SurA
MDIKTVDEYLELFINFKLKVIEAESLGMDTLTEFTEELNMYKEELAKPYFIDNELYEKLITEAYERMKTEVRLSYMFFEISSNASLSDTLQIYNNAVKTYNKLLKGEDFDKVAADSTLGIKSSGDTWFLTSLKAPYQIENFMYQNKINSFSKPLREKNGYYIVKITDIRTNPGEVKVAHIMVTVPEGSTEETETAAKEKIEMIKEKLNSGGDFAELAKEYSDDKSSGAKGGELMMFGSGVMVQEFETAAFALKNIDDISEPIRTFYGWHILKKLESKGIKTYEEMYEDLKSKVNNDARYDICKENVITKLKNEYSFTQVNKINNFYKIVDSTIFKSSWEPSKAEGLNAVLFTFADQKITEQDFAKYLSENQKWQADKDLNKFVDNAYEEYVNEKLKEYEKANLSNKYEDFRYIMQEYHDGILLFSLQEKMVWNKAVEDSAGLEKFYEENKNNYLAGEKINASIFSFTDASYIASAEKALKKKTKKGLTDSTIVSLVDVTGENFKLVETDKYEEGENEIIDKIFEMKKSGELAENQKIITFEDKNNIVYINELIPVQPKELKEVRGLVIADYQTKLETEWIKELRNKYQITVNEELLKSLK